MVEAIFGAIISLLLFAVLVIVGILMVILKAVGALNLSWMVSLCPLAVAFVILVVCKIRSYRD